MNVLESEIGCRPHYGITGVEYLVGASSVLDILDKLHLKDGFKLIIGVGGLGGETVSVH